MSEWQMPAHCEEGVVGGGGDKVSYDSAGEKQKVARKGVRRRCGDD